MVTGISRTWSNRRKQQPIFFPFVTYVFFVVNSSLALALGVLLGAFGLLCGVSVARAEERANLEYFTNKQSGKVTYIKNKAVEEVRALAAVQGAGALADAEGRESVLRIPTSTPVTQMPTAADDPVAIADTFLNQNGKPLGVGSPQVEVLPYEITDDQIEMTHVRFRQYYQGIPVYGSEVVVHLDKEKNVQSVNGNLIPGIQVDAVPVVSKDEAVTLARKYYAAQFTTPEPEVLSTALQVFSPALLTNTAAKSYYLAWEIHLFEARSHVDQVFYVDAKTGGLIYQLDAMRSANPYSVDRWIFDCSLAATGVSGTCGLNFVRHLNPEYTFGCSEGLCPRGPHPYTFTPYYGMTDTDDLYNMFSNIHDFLWLKFARSGGNARGGIGDNKTHGTASYPYSLTTGFTFTDAVGLGDPIAGFNYYAVNVHSQAVIPDLIQHEYGHSLTYFLSFNPDGTYNSMTYYGETGALTEDFSDVLGEGFENYLTGTNDWLFVNEPMFGGPFRNLADPKSVWPNPEGYPYPDRHNDPDFYCGTDDNGGLHINANVMNKGAYLVAMGGSFNGCTIQGLGLEKMLQIWYRAVAYYYTMNSTFNEAYTALTSACNDLYSAADCAEVTKALQAVEIDQGGTCSGIPPVAPACAENPCSGNSLSSPGVEPTPLPKNRSISFAPGNAGRQTAIRVKLISLHHPDPPYSGGPSVPFTLFEGQSLYVGPPAQYVESASSGIPFRASALQCAPYYQDWSTVSLLHVMGEAVVPSSAYDVQMIVQGCNTADEANYSAALTMATTRWGDVETPYNPPATDPQPDTSDISALVNKFKSALGAPIKARALLAGGNARGTMGPAEISPDMSFTHISLCVDAFKGLPYPYKPGKCTGDATKACITDADCTNAPNPTAGPCTLCP